MRAALLELGATIWSFLLFLPLFLLLFLLGITKGIIVAPLALAAIFVGNVAVAAALWPAFVFWTYKSIIKTKMLELSLKIVAALCLPVLLVLWLTAVVFGSVLAGLGYGFFTPLVATCEAVGEGRENKLVRCITDGTWDTLKGSCTVVRDFTDWCYHSCPAYLSDFRDQEPKDGPYGIRLLEIPQCFIVAVLGVMVDVPMFGLIAVVKSPFMLVKGWERLLDDLIVSRDGACGKVACVPFAGLAILLWPLVVVAAVMSAVFSSVFIGLNAAVIVHQEKSFRSGLAYIVAMVAEFDEYTNDVLYLREGSFLPRPRYTNRGARPEATSPAPVSTRSSLYSRSDKPKQEAEQTAGEPGTLLPQLSASKSLRQTLQEVKMVQVWDHMFKTCEKYGQELVQKGVVTSSDLDEWLRSSDRNKSKLVGVGLPAHTLLKNLIVSAKSDTTGLILYNGMELTMFNRPQDRLLDWFFEPLIILKEQIKAARLQAGEERYLEKITLLSPDSAGFMKSWENGSIQPEDNVKKGELEAISRRIQGIATTVSRFPTFRRRYENFIKSLFVFSQARREGSSVKDANSSHSLGDESV